MDTKTLREKSVDELKGVLNDLLKEQFNLRMQQATGQLSLPSQMKVVRRDIARIKTVMNEIKSGGAQ